MAKRKINEAEKARIEQANKVLQDLYALEMKWADDDGENIDELILKPNRGEVAPPPPPEKTKYNPDGIVDIITFAEHEYFCNLRLHPWQKLTLKLFYMGTEGNQNLQVAEEAVPATGCDKCIWVYSKKSEELAAKAWSNNQRAKSILPVENSPCLRCSRFDPNMRQLRFEELKDKATTLAEERKYDRLEKQLLEDQYCNEFNLLNHPEFNQEIRKQVEHKMGNKFTELVMVIGRRAGKSFITVISSLYETYRLLSMGHPQAKYHLLDFEPIKIVNVAKSEKQAKEGIFDKIKPLVQSSPYFMTVLGNALTDEIHFLTEKDKEENKRLAALNMPLMDGSIVLKCGHSNAAGLVGGTAWQINLDEVAAMAGENPDSGVDYKLYEDLVPMVATFGEDGKVILLSNPKGPIGLLYDLYEERKTDPNTLILQLPTWLINPSIPQDYLDQQRARSPRTFPMQYGAEFGETSTDPWLDAEMLEPAFYHRTQVRIETAQSNFVYYLHVDPARSSDYYALAVAHLVQTDKPDAPEVYVDHIHYWAPENGKPVNSDEVEEYIIELHKRFKFRQVSFDQWNSQSAIAKLTKANINAVCKPFTRSYQEMIYGTLYQLLVDNRIFIYNVNTVWTHPRTGKMISLQEIDLTKSQLKMLQKKWKGNKFKIEALSGYHDDIPDCIAAAAYECLNTKYFQPLPRTRVVYAGP